MVVLKNKALRSIVLALLMAAGLLVAGLLASVEPARATFPGDNGRIAFSSNRAPATSFQIYSVASTGREADLNPVTTQLAGIDDYPAYSPDGTKIAFARNTGGNWDIWTISSTGANANRITDSPATDVYPTWSPDGKRIAFSSNRAPATSYQIYSVASTGREADLNPVTTQLAGTDLYPAYSPDGNKIAFQRTVGGANANIWTINSTGGTNANQITDDPAQDRNPDYSPDGKRIAFSSNRAPATSYQIYSVASTGREADLNPVTTQLAGFDEAPAYSPDGNKIAFQRTVGGANANIWTINSTGGANANQITDDPAFDANPTWQSLPKATPPPPGNNSAPTITNFRPAPNSKIRNRSPLISATVKDAEDNLSAADIKLFVDGNRKAAADFSYKPTTDKLSYKSKQLSRGRHTVRIVATDTKGSSTQKTWGFRVRKNAP